MSTNGNGKSEFSGKEPELNSTKSAIERELVFVELKEEIRQKLELPTVVPILKTDLDKELGGGEISVAAFAAGVEALKLVQPATMGYDRFLARYYLLEGERFLQSGETERYQAQRYLQKSLDLDQDEISAEAAYYLGALISPDDPEAAIGFYRQSLQLNPLAATPHFELALLLRERRDLQGALDEFEAAYRLDTNSANLLNEIGETHILTKDWLKAQASFKRAAEIEPDVWVLPVKLGLVEFELGDYAQAIRDLRRGLDAAPDALDEGQDQNLYTEGLYCLALSYKALGRPDQSRKLYRAILQFNPQHEGALEGLNEL